MNIRQLARKIKRVHDGLIKHPVYKTYPIVWNEGLQIAEISVVCDVNFRAVVIGDTRELPASRGYMYLFYTVNDDEKLPAVKEIMNRLMAVAQGKELHRDNVSYNKHEKYSLEEQRQYFAEIVKREIEN